MRKIRVPFDLSCIRRETMGYKTCPHCGANLDAGEKCDCREETVRGKQMKEEKEEHSYE